MERLLLTGVFTGLGLIACTPAIIQQVWLAERTVGPASVQVSARLERAPQTLNATPTLDENDCHLFTLVEG